jgi:serine/threonine-protein kinase RsbW
MPPLIHHFDNLETLIDQAHALFVGWATDHALAPGIDAHTVYQLKLAVHEWLANLVQHANFSRCPTDISLTIEPEGEKLRCTIRDNSDGFDMDAHLDIEPSFLDAFPERGMGILLLKICTEELSYQRLPHGTNSLEFTIAADPEIHG